MDLYKHVTYIFYTYDNSQQVLLFLFQSWENRFNEMKDSVEVHRSNKWLSFWAQGHLTHDLTILLYCCGILFLHLLIHKVLVETAF